MAAGPRTSPGSFRTDAPIPRRAIPRSLCVPYQGTVAASGSCTDRVVPGHPALVLDTQHSCKVYQASGDGMPLPVETLVHRSAPLSPLPECRPQQDAVLIQPESWEAALSRLRGRSVQLPEKSWRRHRGIQPQNRFGALANGYPVKYCKSFVCFTQWPVNVSLNALTRHGNVPPYHQCGECSNGECGAST